MSFANLNFETAGSSPGQADQWSVTSSTTGFEAADFAGEGTNVFGYESFEEGWGEVLFVFTSSSLSSAVFSLGLEIEGFENGWGPVDGSDSDYGTKVVSGVFGDNTGFVFELTSLEAPVFNIIVPNSLENFEREWLGNENFVFDFVGLGTDLSAAQFDTAMETVEDFEEEWLGNENFIFNFVGVGTDLEAAQFNVNGSLVSEETFEEALEFYLFFDVVNAVSGGTYELTINGRVGQYVALPTDDQDDIADGLIAAIQNVGSTAGISASPFVATLGRFAVFVDGPSQDGSIAASITGPSASDVQDVTTLIRDTDWGQPLFGF